MKTVFVCEIVVALGMALGVANAAPLPVVNPGFDNLYTTPAMTTPFTLNGDTYGLGGPGNYTYCTQNGEVNQACYVPGWGSENGTWGYGDVINSTAPFAHSGNVMEVRTGWGKQDLVSTVQAGTYVFTVDIGIPTNSSTDTRSWSLQANRGTFWSVLENPVVNESLVPGSFVNCTTTYTVDPTSSNIGAPILIVFDATLGTYLVDNIAVDFTPVPEPASLALLGLGGLAFLRRRRG